MSTKIIYNYCKVCKQEVEEPRRKPLTRTQKTIWVILMVATIGIAVLVYLIYIFTRLKEYCPVCSTKLIKSDEPFEKPKKKREEMTPKERILDKTGLEEEEPKEQPIKTEPIKEKKEGEKIICPYCGAELEEKLPTCSFCKSVLEW